MGGTIVFVVAGEVEWSFAMSRDDCHIGKVTFQHYRDNVKITEGEH
ncbi:hypothetical protein OKW35_000378 [Paraburkholderia sp. MM5477-R1]